MKTFLLNFLAILYHWLSLILYLGKCMDTIMLVCMLNQKKLLQVFYIQFLQKRSSIFNRDFFDCQLNEIEIMKENLASLLPFLKLSNFLSIKDLWILKVQLSLPLEEIMIYMELLILSACTLWRYQHQSNAHQALFYLFHHWSPKFSHPHYLVTDEGFENPNSEMANCYTLPNSRHSPRSSHAPWTRWLVEVQCKKFGNHLEPFFHDTPDNYSLEMQFFAHAHKI